MQQPLRIQSPCSENWEAMTPLGNGNRHCQSCNKVVHDLTQATPEEMLRLYRENAGQLCARMTQHVRIPQSTIRKEGLHHQAQKPKFKLNLAASAAAFWLFASQAHAQIASPNGPPTMTIWNQDLIAEDTIALEDSLIPSTAALDTTAIDSGATVAVLQEPSVSSSDDDSIRYGQIEPMVCFPQILLGYTIVAGIIGYYPEEESPFERSENEFSCTERLPILEHPMPSAPEYVEGPILLPASGEKTGINLIPQPILPIDLSRILFRQRRFRRQAIHQTIRRKRPPQDPHPTQLPWTT